MKHVYIFYFFITLLSGIVSLTLISLAYIKTKERLLEYCLAFHSCFTLLVMVNIGALYLLTATDVRGETSYFFQSFTYFESYIASYLVIFSLPLFLHELCSVPQARLRNRIIAGIAICTSIMTHGMLFLETPFIVEVISVCIELMVILGVIGYSACIPFYYARHIHNPSKKTLARTMAIFLAIALPGIVNDLLHIFPVEFFPMLYCGLSILFTHHLLKHHYLRHPHVSGFIVPDEAFFDQYNISSREKEIIPLILQGESNKKISDILCISPNTLKTHIRNIYAKFGVKSRVEFITFMRDASFLPPSDR